MDMQIFVTPHSTNLFLMTGIGLIVMSLAYLRLLVIVERTRRAFRVLQPEIRITKVETVYAEGKDRLTFNLRNVGGTQATNISVTIHGKEGIEPCPIIPELTPGAPEQKVWIKAESNSPLLCEKRNNIRLMIRYRDQWGYPYTISYPVVQRESIYGWVSLQLVDRGKPRVSKPFVSFLRMRKYLHQNAQNIRYANVPEEVLRRKVDLAHDELLSRSLLRSYFSKVWQTQNKQCSSTPKIVSHP